MPLELPLPDRTVLPRAPLQLVIFQVRHEMTLASSDSSVALRFHHAIGGREGPFPEIAPMSGTSLQVTVGPSAVPQTEATSRLGWRFTASDAAWAVTLLGDQVSLETTRYRSWDDFRDKAHTVLDALAEYVKPAIEQRVGLRYINRITDMALGRPIGWRDLIAPEFLGPVLHEHLGPAIQAAQQVLVIDLGNNESCGLRHGFLRDAGVEAPLDYLIDCDLYREGGREFNGEDIKNVAERFNVYALQLFQAAITKDLLDKLTEG